MGTRLALVENMIKEGEMRLILKIIELMVDAVIQILGPQRPVVTGSYLARRDAMRRWQDHSYDR
jgi:hypothetical protein